MRSSTGAAQPGILSSTRSAAYVASARIPGSWANRHPYDYILQAFLGIVLDQSRASEYFPRLTWPATHPVCFIKRRHLAPNTAKPWGQAGGRSPGILERSVPRVFIITAP